MGKNPIVASVVIAVRGDERALRALEALEVQSTLRNTYELILVENGTACLGERVAPNIIYRHLSDANMPAARNVGLRLARGEFVLFTDADCVPHEDWIARMVSALETQDHAGIGGRIERYRPESATQQFGSNIVNGQQTLSYLPALRLPYVAGANAGFRRDSLIQAGGFDEELLSGNDVDICYKLGLAGFSIGIASDALVFHDNRATVISHFRRFYNYARFQVLLFKKYKPESRKSFVINPYPWRLLVRAVASLPVGLVRCARGERGAIWRSLLLLVEAAGVLCGDLRGSFAYREIYI